MRWQLTRDYGGVRDGLKSMTQLDADKRQSDNPVVASVCYVLYELMTIKPWFADDSEPFLVD